MNSSEFAVMDILCFSVFQALWHWTNICKLNVSMCVTKYVKGCECQCPKKQYYIEQHTSLTSWVGTSMTLSCRLVFRIGRSRPRDWFCWGKRAEHWWSALVQQKCIRTCVYIKYTNACMYTHTRHHTTHTQTHTNIDTHMHTHPLVPSASMPVVSQVPWADSTHGAWCITSSLLNQTNNPREKEALAGFHAFLQEA